ncbi:MAG: carbonic anhydrase [bacterium]|nr:carbonic anhydrase [bacterium]
MRSAFILLLAYCLAALASDKPPVHTVSKSLEKLRDGNERFVKGQPARWNSGDARRQELSGGQTPYACVITCADSRVPPEQIFDAGLGELFVIRVAGNVTPPEVIASADYAVGHLHCPVVVVMGHTKCGAVAAALTATEFAEPLKTLIDGIRPSVEACEHKGYDGESLYAGTIKENARSGAMSLLSGSRHIEEAVAEGHCTVLSAVYDIETGGVEWQSQMVNIAWNAPQKEHAPDEVKHEPEPRSAEAPEAHQQTTRQSVSSTKKRH